jgi:hypothetical protein
MGVAGAQHEAAQSLQIRVGHHALDEPLAQPLATRLLQHIDVAQIRKRGTVGDDPGQSQLAIVVCQQREAERVRYGPRQQSLWYGLRPVRPAQVGVSGVEVDPRRIRRDDVAAATALEGQEHEHRASPMIAARRKGLPHPDRG